MGKHVREDSFLRRVAPAFTILSAIVAVTALFLNTSVRRRDFSCTYLGSENIIQVNKGALPGPLTILFQDHPIQALYSLKFSIRNDGSSAIKDSDIKEALALTFPSGFTLLGQPSIQTRPNFALSAQIDQLDPQRVLLSFPLMNSGDEASLSINALSLGQESPTLIGRIVDVKQIANIDNSKVRNVGKAQRVSAPLIWTLMVLNGLLGATSVFMVGWASWIFARQKLRLRRHTKTAASVGLEQVPPAPDEGMNTWRDYLMVAPLFLLLASVFSLSAYALYASALGV